MRVCKDKQRVQSFCFNIIKQEKHRGRYFSVVAAIKRDINKKPLKLRAFCDEY